MVKVIISTSDPIVYTLKDEQTSNEYFGSDYIQDYGVEIPEELLLSYEKAFQDFWNVQMEIEKYAKKS